MNYIPLLYNVLQIILLFISFFLLFRGNLLPNISIKHCKETIKKSIKNLLN